MSRTDKDRPWWVRLNDDTIPMSYKHNHQMFGVILVPYWRENNKVADHCTAFEKLTWHTWDDKSLLPCRRWTLVPDLVGGLNYPHDCRVKPYRAKRRDFIKRQVKIYNSNPEMHDDLEFMNDEEFELTKREKSHSRWF